MVRLPDVKFSFSSFLSMNFMATDPISRISYPDPGPATGAPWQFLPTRVHGVLDYLMGLVLIVLPFVPGFPRLEAHPSATWIPLALGVGALVYSLVTNYEFGLLRLLPMPVHLAFDFLSGVLLASSPWLFGFYHQVYLPHFILGIFEIGAALFTRPRPFARSTIEVARLPSVLF